MPTAKESGRFKRLRGAFFLLVGTSALVIAAAVAAEQREFLAQATTAAGVVTSLNAGGSHPNIRFSDASGQVFTFPEGGWISGYRTGQRVRVLYLANEPAVSACLDDWGSIWFAPTFIGALGLVHFSAGLYLLWRQGDNDARSP